MPHIGSKLVHLNCVVGSPSADLVLAKRFWGLISGNFHTRGTAWPLESIVFLELLRKLLLEVMYGRGIVLVQCFCGCHPVDVSPWSAGFPCFLPYG